jgi:hypothetical protein
MELMGEISLSITIFVLLLMSYFDYKLIKALKSDIQGMRDRIDAMKKDFSLCREELGENEH